MLQRVVTLIITLLIIVLATSSVNLTSNPIPVPTLIMGREYIVITIDCSRRDELIVNVTGIYPFKNVSHKSAIMYFPVPPEALENEVKVFFNNREVVWKVSEKKYDTAIGKYPMIYWKLSDLPKNFEVKVYYKYSIKKSRGAFKILYAMATGRYLNGTYTKQCVAEVKFRTIGVPEGWIAKVSFVPPPSEAFGVGYESEIEVPLILLDKITFKRASRPFKGMDRDVLVTIVPKGVVPEERWIKYYPSKEEIEVSLNVTDTNVLKVLVKFTFRHGGFKVNVVEKKVEESNVLLRLSVLEWTGPSIQVITRITVEEEYELKPGDYTFTLKIHDRVYFSQKIHIGGSNFNEFSLSSNNLITIFCIVACVIVLALILRFKYYKK